MGKFFCDKNKTILKTIIFILVYLIFLEKAKHFKPYSKPTQVDKQKILKRQDKYVEGTRQINSVTSEKRVKGFG